MLLSWTKQEKVRREVRSYNWNILVKTLVSILKVVTNYDDVSRSFRRAQNADLSIKPALQYDLNLSFQLVLRSLIHFWICSVTLGHLQGVKETHRHIMYYACVHHIYRSSFVIPLRAQVDQTNRSTSFSTDHVRNSIKGTLDPNLVLQMQFGTSANSFTYFVGTNIKSDCPAGGWTIIFLILCACWTFGQLGLFSGGLKIFCRSVRLALRFGCLGKNQIHQADK